MTTKWLINSILILAATVTSLSLVLGSWQPSRPVEAGFAQTTNDQVRHFEQVREQIILEDIQRLESLGYLAPLAAPVTLPFEYVGGHILISAQIHDLATTKALIVDSGIRSTLLDQDVVSSRALASVIQVDPNAVYGLLNRVRLADAEFYNVGAFTVEFSAPGQPLYCLSDSGVIGASMLRQAVWQINYQNQTLTIVNSVEDLNVADAIAIPFETENFIPVVALNLGHDQIVNAVVDTGWGGGIHVSPQDWASIDTSHFREVSTSEGLIETLRGLQPFTQKMFLVPVVSLGNVMLKEFPVVVNPGELIQPRSLIGNQFLENFIVTVDWTNHQLYLKPISADSDPYFNPPIYGFQAIVHNRALIITGLYRPSLAAAAGLEIGDQILSINNDSYGHLDEEQTCAFVRSPVGDRYSGPITMTVKRNGNLLTYTLIPESESN